MQELIKIHRYVNESLKLEINQNTRKRPIVEGRYLFFAIARKCTHLSLEKIGMYLGINNKLLKKDHASVLHGVNVFNDVLILDKRYKSIYNLYINDKWIDEDISSDNINKKLKKQNFELKDKVTELRVKLKEKVPFLEDYYKLPDNEREIASERLKLIIRMMPSRQHRKEVTKYERINCEM